jgi:hypothetical protein
MDTNACSETPKERQHLGYLEVDGGLVDTSAVGFEVVDRIHLAHDTDQWRSPVNTLMNLSIVPW